MSKTAKSSTSKTTRTRRANHVIEETLYPSYMVETNGGGRIESVQGFNCAKALTSGFEHCRVPLRMRSRMAGIDLDMAVPQFTFGEDNRVAIAETTSLPWRCVCHLVVESNSGRQVFGTGWLAGPSTVLTAGHNLLDAASGHEAVRVWVLPGRFGDVAPYGYDSSTVFEVHPKWRAHADREFDLGAVRLVKPMGTRLGWFGFTALSDGHLRSLLVNNAGYPADKPLGTQWFNAGRVMQVRPHAISYGLDTELGQSGSPIFYFDEHARRIVVAVHAYGTSGENIGVRVTPDVYKTFMDWVK